MGVVAAIVKSELRKFVEGSDLATLAILSTYAKSEEFPSLCDILATRLETAGDLHSATLCFMCAVNVEKTVHAWCQESEAESRMHGQTVALHSLVEKVSVFARAVDQADQAIGPEVAQRFAEYASFMAAEGRLDIAAKYARFPDLSCAILKDRIFNAHPIQGYQPPPFPFDVVQIQSQAQIERQQQQQQQQHQQQQQQQRGYNSKFADGAGTNQFGASAAPKPSPAPMHPSAYGGTQGVTPSRHNNTRRYKHQAFHDSLPQQSGGYPTQQQPAYAGRAPQTPYVGQSAQSPYTGSPVPTPFPGESAAPAFPDQVQKNRPAPPQQPSYGRPQQPGFSGQQFPQQGPPSSSGNRSHEQVYSGPPSAGRTSHMPSSAYSGVPRGTGFVPAAGTSSPPIPQSTGVNPLAAAMGSSRFAKPSVDMSSHQRGGFVSSVVNKELTLKYGNATTASLSPVASATPRAGSFPPNVVPGSTENLGPQDLPIVNAFNDLVGQLQGLPLTMVRRSLCWMIAIPR
ncbi:hypothetical protein PsorP6_009191 [Peronosclerospora sorghi]|uniref:Uncharacterized protein n=1 Tax=Peronosclerospora sorghi TaxID=230839 RepID=A0ACC0VYR8_9STRA|nr:hypothetical protein PsorP6_009191 [Peronosclerospora sorghi]